MPCLKIPYESRADARRAAQSRSRSPVQGLRPMYCKHCRKWHLTTTSVADLKRKKRS